MKFDKINMIYGLIATIGAALFGEYWFLFAGFLILNVIDYEPGTVRQDSIKRMSRAPSVQRASLKRCGTGW